MTSKNDFIDFDEDLDDILLSDEETTLKSKKNISLKKNNTEAVKENTNVNDNNKINNTLPTPLITNKASKPNLFDDNDDHMEMIDIPKKSSKNNDQSLKKGAKSVLDSLLNPVTELDDFSFNKSEPKSKAINVTNGDIKIDKIKSNEDDFWKMSNYKPSTAEPKIKDSNIGVSNKRTVRFSTDALADDQLDSSLTLRGRPVTAPSLTTDVSKSKFISRFEEAEYDNVLPKHDLKFNSESDPSLWKGTISEDFLGNSVLESKVKSEEDEIRLNNKDGNNRSNPKQKLSEFLQTSNDDLFSRTIPKTQYSQMELSGQSSFEDLSSPQKSTKLDESFSSRRSSVQVENSFDIARTVNRRRSSVQADIILERPRTGHGRLENFQTKVEGSRDDRSDIDLKLKHLQGEKDDLLYKLEGIIKRNKEEMDIMEKSYKNRIELMEDNMQRKEKRFQEEIEILSIQNKQKLQMLEDERMEMRSELSKREDDMDHQKRQEIARIREQHKLELDRLRYNHEDLIQKLNQAKSEEDSTLRLAQPTTTQLQSVLTQVSNGAHDLASLKQQFLDQMNQQIKEKDMELKLKNESLRQLEEQLNLQKDENVKERERLQSLIYKLDIQLKEQSKQAEEERWYIRQEQNKLTAMQSSLEKEREHILIEKDQNRSSHEQFRTKLLEEQKQLFDQVYEEKRALAEERAKLTREVSKWSESSQISSVKKNQEFAELEGIRAALADERKEIELMRAQIVKEREENIQKNSQLTSMSYELRLKAERLNQLELEITAKQNSIETKEKNSRYLHENGEEAFRQAKEIQNSHQEQLKNIQKQLIQLTEKEKQMNKEKIELEKVKVNIINQNKSIKCSKCSNVLRDSAIGGSLNNINTISTHLPIPKIQGQGRCDSYFDQGITNSMEYSNFISGQFEEERLIHSIKRAADKDREYLDNERAYLRSLAMTQEDFWRNQVKS